MKTYACRAEVGDDIHYFLRPHLSLIKDVKAGPFPAAQQPISAKRPIFA